MIPIYFYGNKLIAMKYLILISALILFETSCKKVSEIPGNSSKDINQVIGQLKDSLSKNDYEALDFSKPVITKFQDHSKCIRIPFKGKSIENQFVLLQTDKTDNINKGRIININQDTTISNFSFEGHISISSLKGEMLVTSKISKGYIVAFHNRQISRTYSRLYSAYVEPSPYEWLPEVVVVGYIRDGGGISFGNYIALQNILDRYS